MISKITLRLFFIACFAIIYSTSKSDSTGRFNNGTPCTPCHGSGSTNTIVAINGLPTEYIKGKIYPLTFTVENPGNAKAGFNIQVSGGALAAGTGSKINSAKSQITHTTPKSATNNIVTFSFNWTAPTSTATSVTFTAVGNSVNGNGKDGIGDEWNSTSETIPVSTTSGIENTKVLKLQCYPNPATDYLMIDGNAISSFEVYNMEGKLMPVSFEMMHGNYRIDLRKLAPGTYLIHGNDGEQSVSGTFIKN